jgi:hypothetical protein
VHLIILFIHIFIFGFFFQNSLPNSSARNQELNPDDGYETGGATGDMLSTHQHLSMNGMLPNNYHYMMSSRNMQRQTNLPKMEYSNDSRHGQTTPSTPGGISDDPYRFVDDELSSPTQMIVNNGINSSSQQSANILSNYGMNGETMLNNPPEPPLNMNNLMRSHVSNDVTMPNNASMMKEPKKRGRKKKAKEENW